MRSLHAKAPLRTETKGKESLSEKLLRVPLIDKQKAIKRDSWRKLKFTYYFELYFFKSFSNGRHKNTLSMKLELSVAYSHNFLTSNK